MADEVDDARPWRCLFCRMHTGVRLFGAPVCGICRDQVQDFAWVSVLQVLFVSIGFNSVGQFLAEELLLFVILVLVKHRLPNLFERFVERAGP